MRQLLYTEWLKVKNYRTFWVLSALFLISIFGINYIAYQIQDARPKDNPMADALIGVPPFQFPEVWQTVAYMSSFLLFIPGLLMIISLTNEFSFRTHRQNIIDGWSRNQFISVKLLLVLILSLASTLIVLGNAYFFGMAEARPFSAEKMEYIGYFFLQAMSYTAVALLFGLLFRRSGIAIGVYFLYVVVLENMIAGLLNRYAGNTGYFLPLESSDSLIPFPFLRELTKRFVERPDATYLLVATGVYLVLYYFLARRKFETTDL
ncbi:MAG TPA: ABC transporter permease [Chitinophagaceae bacterium]|jgi:hypothetical protein|nr:ABC transporter permease [Chitinophagaceae bacterium]